VQVIVYHFSAKFIAILRHDPASILKILKIYSIIKAEIMLLEGKTRCKTLIALMDYQ